MNKYLIPKGDHYSSLIEIIPQIPTPPGVHNGATAIFGKIKFTESCKYNLSGNPNCINDTNKAIGIGYGWLPNAHHIWSFRLGWRVNSFGKLILLLYYYENGTRNEVRIGTSNSFKFNTEYDFYLVNDVVHKELKLTVGSEVVTVTSFVKSPAFGYILKPYFGGDCTAPNDMIIEIDYNIL